MEFPGRIQGLIERLEAGDDPTPEELRRLALLQALDVAKLGEDYVSAAIAQDKQLTEDFRQKMMR